MNETRITIKFEPETTGFSPDKVYEVIELQERQVLVVNDEARLTWVEASQPIVVAVDRPSGRIFDLEIHLKRRHLESLAGKRVVLTTWEHIGFDPDEITSENMYLYRGTVDRYDGETLFLRRDAEEEGLFGVLPKAIATLQEEG